MPKEKKDILPNEIKKTKGFSARREEVLVKTGDTSNGTVRKSEWLDVAKKLEGQEFTSINDAMGCLVNEVLEQLGQTSRPKDELKNFLFTLLATDPELQEELQRILKC